MLSYNVEMYSMFDDPVDLLKTPRQEGWSGDQIHQLLDDMQRHCEVSSHLNIPVSEKALTKTCLHNRCSGHW